MPTITSTGVGSGLDVNSIVTSLMALEKRPLTLLQTQASTLQNRISAFGTLKSAIANLGDVATRLADAANWNPQVASASDTAAAGISAGNTASAGSWKLQVQQLAQAQSLASAPYASATSPVGGGTLKIELGTTAGGAFTARSGASPVSITIDPAKSSLADVRDAINVAGAGVTASLVNDASGARLVLRSATGADSSLRITATDADGNDTDAAGLSALAHDPAAGAGAGRNLAQTQAAQDAKFTLDGLALSSATNTVSSAISGVTLTLKQVTDAPVDLSVSQDTAAVRKNVTDFVNAYNNVARLLAQQTKADPGGANRGPLQADFTARSMASGVRELLFGAVSGLAGAASLSAAGIELQKDGTLLAIDAKVDKAAAVPGQLARLFAQAQQGTDAATRGIALRFKQWANLATGDGGALAGRLEGLNQGVSANQKAQDKAQDKLTRTEARLRAQYQRLDSQMSTLNAQMAKMKSTLGLA